MHINVRDILAESVGYSRLYTISGEHPQLHSVILTAEVTGEVTLARLETANILAQGWVSTEIELECYRCLRTFSRPVRVNFKQIFAGTPGDDEMPLVDHEIDLAPLIEQEIILSLPIKILDSPDCPGIQPSEATTPEAPPDLSLKARARIIKEER